MRLHTNKFFLKKLSHRVYILTLQINGSYFKQGHIYRFTFSFNIAYYIVFNGGIFIPPANEVAGIYSDPYVRPFVRSFVRPSVRPSQSLIRYSSKTAEQNFMKLSGIVHYMMPYCTSYFKILGFPRAKQGLCHYDIWGNPSVIRYSS